MLTEVRDGTFATVLPPFGLYCGRIMLNNPDDKLIWTASGTMFYDWPPHNYQPMTAEGANDPDFSPYLQYSGAPLPAPADANNNFQRLCSANRLKTPDGSPDPSFNRRARLFSHSSWTED